MKVLTFSLLLSISPIFDSGLFNVYFSTTGKHSSVSVVIARENYPEDENTESVISGTENVQDSLIFYSSCRKAENREGYYFKSGRLITVTTVAETLAEARKLCYDDIDRLELKGIRYRKDIWLKK